MKTELIITPKTKVFQLLEHYPQLENTLIEYVPAFIKLKNPILKNTIAKITSLQQAALVGNVEIQALINILRKEVGQDAIETDNEINYNMTKPNWFVDENIISGEINIEEYFNRGEQPVNQVIADLKLLKNKEIYKVISPFIPAPLIDKAISLNLKHWVDKKNDEYYLIFFCK